MGPGPGKKTSERLAYGPGPGGSFDTFCGAGLAYDLPPLHVYKERSSHFTISPCRTKAPVYRPQRFAPTPSWSERLAMTPGQAAQFRKDGSMPWKGSGVPSTNGMPRPQSAAALLSRLPRSQSAERLLQTVPPESRIGIGCCGIYVIEPLGSRPLKRSGSRMGKSTGSLLPQTTPSHSPVGVITSDLGAMHVSAPAPAVAQPPAPRVEDAAEAAPTPAPAPAPEVVASAPAAALATEVLPKIAALVAAAPESA